MQMQAVELISRHGVDLTLQEVDGTEMARHIEHHRTPLVCRCVNHIAACHSLLRSQLSHRSPSQTEAVGTGGSDKDGVGRNMQLVGFGLSTVFQRQSGYRLWRQSVEYHHLAGASLANSHPWLGIDVAGDVPHPVLHSHLSATGMECAFGWRIRLWFGQYALC